MSFCKDRVWLMFVLLVFTACLTLTKANSNEGIKAFKEMLSNYSEDCHAQTNSNYALTMDMFYNGQDYKPGTCFVRCILEKFNLMNGKGLILEDKVKESIKKIPNEKAQMIANNHLNECLHTASDRDQCKKAFLFANCFFQHSRNKKYNSKR